MQVSQEKLNPTTIKLTIVADQQELNLAKNTVISRLKKNVTVPGFRAGKAPDHLVEKNIEANVLQSEVIEEAINRIYPDAVRSQNIKIVSQPKLSVSKFVPFTALEFTAEVEYLGDIKLADYKKLKIPAPTVSVTASEVAKVIENLATRGAVKKVVNRSAKKGDEVNIDFAGFEKGTDTPLDGTDGKNYPLVLGSKSFIPGFEEKLVGLSAKDEKTFNITFPEDYGAKHMQSKTVTFKVTVNEVNEMTMPKIDDKFASTVGPFKTLVELKNDIKKQLSNEKKQESLRAQENLILEELSKKTKITIPESLINEEIERMETEEKRNMMYQGKTWQEHLKEEGITEEAHRERQRPTAEIRIKSGIILGEVAEAEEIKVSEEEFELRMKLLKAQYTDEAMQAELNKPENQRDIMSRMLTEKTLDKLRDYASK